MPTYSSKEDCFVRLYSLLYKKIIQPFKIKTLDKTKFLQLEIGPGDNPIEGFLTLNLIKDKNTSFVSDSFSPLPFEDNTFDIIYASHVFEHCPWYMHKKVLAEWKRILKPNGCLEIWVPDGLKIAESFVNAEKIGSLEWLNDNWFRFNEEKDSCVCFSGRMFSYGDGSGNRNHRNWHLSCFSERYLRKLYSESGLVNIERLEHKDCRGYDHGWINLGISGRKITPQSNLK